MQPANYVPPYSKLAAFYDGMMEHVDYYHWAHYIDKIFKKSGKSISTVCEVACGTGTLAIALSKLNYAMTCSDISPDMVAVASEKARREGVQIMFSSQNMLEFNSEKKFDAVLCLYDSINYLQGRDEIVRFLQNAENLVGDDGLLIFDACTEHNSIKNFNQRYEYDKTHHYRRRSYYLQEQRVQVNEITLQVDGSFYTEKHTQNIFVIADMVEMIRTTSFRLKDMFENLTFRKGRENSERVHFVLGKKGNTHFN